MGSSAIRTPSSYLAHRRGHDFGRFQYATRQTLELDPLPCLKHLTPEQRQRLVAAMATEIEEAAAAHLDRTGAKPLGRAAILAQNPLSQPVRLLRSRLPFFVMSKQYRTILT